MIKKECQITSGTLFQIFCLNSSYSSVPYSFTSLFRYS